MEFIDKSKWLPGLNRAFGLEDPADLMKAAYDVLCCLDKYDIATAAFLANCEVNSCMTLTTMLEKMLKCTPTQQINFLRSLYTGNEDFRRKLHAHLEVTGLLNAYELQYKFKNLSGVEFRGLISPLYNKVLEMAEKLPRVENLCGAIRRYMPAKFVRNVQYELKARTSGKVEATAFVAGNMMNYAEQSLLSYVLCTTFECIGDIPVTEEEALLMMRANPGLPPRWIPGLTTEFGVMPSLLAYCAEHYSKTLAARYISAIINSMKIDMPKEEQTEKGTQRTYVFTAFRVMGMQPYEKQRAFFQRVMMRYPELANNTRCYIQSRKPPNLQQLDLCLLALTDEPCLSRFAPMKETIAELPTKHPGSPPVLEVVECIEVYEGRKTELGVEMSPELMWQAVKLYPYGHQEQFGEFITYFLPALYAYIKHKKLGKEEWPKAYEFALRYKNPFIILAKSAYPPQKSSF
ncbi:ORF9 [Ranid herpesvirus 2]|uniref:ORF9 n=1 Tax=Ranid herpesvirus 2 TaxID=389214 RepID=Q14W97_9VIRU|nr:ORF9 [Ranid herpesvirus 2]ABG25565.1 ORF9 [Ranid herpesvirus 2]